MNILGISGFKLIFPVFALVICGMPSPAAATTATKDPAVRPPQTLPSALRPVLYRTLAKNAGPAYQVGKNARAVYPLAVDPLVWVEQKVTASDGAENDLFGTSVALSGTTALIGAYYAAVNGNSGEGAVYVFTEADGIWTQTQKLTAGDGATHDHFGFSIALDGTTALIGALHDGSPGAAYVFNKSGDNWTQTAKLTASDGTADNEFGYSVAFDGTTAIVGSPDEYAAYIFDKSDGNWSQTAKLNPEGVLCGSAVALSGSTAFVGAPGASNNGQGLVDVFTKSGGDWVHTQTLYASDGYWFNFFGGSVALADTTAFIGSDTGAAYVFTESGGIWTQTQELTAGGQLLGAAVALSGTHALVDSQYGPAYLYEKSNGIWNQMQEFDNWTVHGDGFYPSVALSGTTALIGVPSDTVHHNEFQGAAYFYDESDLDFAVSAPEAVGQGQNYVSQAIATNNASAASPALAVTVTVPAAASFVSATATQGDCSEDSGMVTCDFGQINGNAGTATANVTLKATGNVGDTIDNTAGIAKATPPLTASAATTITTGGGCPTGYSEYDGSLNPGEVARSPVYQAPGGEENAILTATAQFQLYTVYQSGRFGRHVYLVPGNEVHRWGPKGLYMWLVRARDGAGAYTLCLQHP